MTAHDCTEVSTLTPADLARITGGIGLGGYRKPEQVKTIVDAGKAVWRAWSKPIPGELTMKGAICSYLHLPKSWWY